jgi:hypothetical protein
MNADHERIQEILAGHALNALDDDLLPEAEFLLGTHVPECSLCREAVEGFEAVAGELALAARPADPPAMLLAGLRRDLRKRGRRARVPVGGVAVAIALIAAFAAWNANLAGQVSQARRHQADSSELIDTVAHPESRVVALGGDLVGNRVLAAYVPGSDRLFLFGSMPTPGDGLVYQVWLQRAGGYASAGTFVPESSGRVFYRIGVDATGVDGVLITEEPPAGSRAPSGRRIVTASL